MYADLMAQRDANPNRQSSADTSFTGAMSRGFKRSLPETKSLLAGAGAAVAGAVGLDGVRDKLLDTSQQIQQEQVAPLAPKSGFIEAVTGDGSLKEWAGDTIGNFGGQALQSVAAAGAGALLGSAAPGAGTAAGAVGGLVGREALKRGVATGVGKMLTEKAATEAGRTSLARMGGAALAPTALNIGQETGIAYTGRAEDAAAAGEELNTQDALRAMGYGTAAGLVDTGAEAFAAGKLLNGISASPSMLKRVAGGAGVGMAVEGGTEGVQAVLERMGAAREITGEESNRDYIENIAAGALGGGVMGAGGGLRRREDLAAPPPPPPEPRAEDLASQTLQPQPSALATPPAGPLTRAAATVTGAAPLATPPVEAVAQPAAEQQDRNGPVPTAAAEPTADPVFEQAKQLIGAAGKVQRGKLAEQLGLNRNQTQTLLDQLQAAGIIGPANGTKARKLLVNPLTGAVVDPDEQARLDRKVERDAQQKALEEAARGGKPAAAIEAAAAAQGQQPAPTLSRPPMKPEFEAKMRERQTAALTRAPRPDPAAGATSAAAAVAFDTGAAALAEQQSAQAAQEQQTQAAVAAQAEADKAQQQQQKVAEKAAKEADKAARQADKDSRQAEKDAQAAALQTTDEDIRATVQAEIDAGKPMDGMRMSALAAKLKVTPKRIDDMRMALAKAKKRGEATPVIAQSTKADQPQTASTPAGSTPLQVESSQTPAAVALETPAAPEAQPSASQTSEFQLSENPYDTSAEVLDDDITPPSGGPFTIRSAAESAAKRNPGARVVEVDGGFVARVPKAVVSAKAPETNTSAATVKESLTVAAAKPKAELAADVAGEQLDDKWTEFALETGTLNVPRSEMPQVKSVHRGAMVQFLGARGITHEQAEVPADSLKPTQAEFSATKVKKALKRAAEGEDRAILVSADGHVLDGHHQWLAKREAGAPVKVIRLNAPIAELLQHVKEFPSSTQAEGATATQPTTTTTQEPTNAKQEAPRTEQAAAAGQAAAEAKPEALLTKRSEAVRALEESKSTAPADIVRAKSDAESRPGFKKSLTILANSMEAKDAKAISQWVADNPDNTMLRAIFTEATGVKLPRTIRGGREAVAAWVAGNSDTVDSTPAPAQDSQQQQPPAAPEQAGNRDTATGSSQDPIDQALVAGPEPAAARKRPGKSGRSDRRGNDGGVQPDRGRSDAGVDGSEDLGNRRGADAVPDGSAGVLESDTQRTPAVPRPGIAKRVGADYVPAPGSLTRKGSWLDAAKRNVDAIELAVKIEAEKRPATLEEQQLLAQYVGFGAGEIRNNLFRVQSNEYARSRDPERLIWPDLAPTEAWKAIATRMADLPRDWQKTILQSTQYAHYTSEGVVRAIWRGLQHMGFTGGRVFEPGFGKGTFPMLMPDSVRASSVFTGVEMDGPSALIGKLLQPQQNMLHGDFIKRKFPRDFFDVGAGNPPFAPTIIESDPEYAKHRFALHDYFFAKSIDRIRPGGLMVFVTSRYTMDKRSSRARQYLADRADLVGAIRLPQTAFRENAGTDVVTDVIILRKRQPGEAPGGQPWLNLAKIQTKDGEIEINEYFAANPDKILGQSRIGGAGQVDDAGRRINTLKPNQYTVVSYDESVEETEQAFERAMLTMPSNIYSPMQQSAAELKAEVAKIDFDPKVRREGVVYLDDDGELMRVENGAGKQLSSMVKLSPADKAWLTGYVEVRTLVQEARQAQVQDGDWKAALKALNKAYDAFREKHGPVNDFTLLTRTTTDDDGVETTVTSKRFKNKRLLKEDYDRAIVQSLEVITEDNQINKAPPFLLERTIGTPPVRKVETVSDALAVSLDEVGSLNIADVAARLNITSEQAIEALGDNVYESLDAGWLMADDYLSGNVVEKLAEAIDAARVDARYERNVKALQAVQPERLGPSQISAKLGASWVPEAVINEFATEIGAGAVKFLPSTEGWQVAGGNKRTERMAGADYGTSARSASELLEAALNSRSVTVMKTVGEGKDRKQVTDKEATDLAVATIKKIKDKFKGWVWTDAARAADLVDIYNERFNNIAPRRFDGEHLTLPGVSMRYKLHPHQKRAIWRQVATGNTYLAHAVGAGKTIEMIAGGMEQKRIGLIQKPMYVVPNHMLEQFANEFMEIYPLANIMVADDENFQTDRRRAFVAAATLNKPDAIIITHSAFERIGVKEESTTDLKAELLDALQEELDRVAEDKDQRVRRAQLQQQIEAVEQRFDKIVGAGSKDSTIKLEDMGVDMLYVDEAHTYRKLDFVTEQKVKGVDPNGSRRALDMYVKTRILQKRRPGRAFVFASGTPVTNTMGELYTVQRFFQPDVLKEGGISQFDSWSRQFGETAANLEANAAGKYELVERFAKFDNVPELMSNIRMFMDVLTSDQLGSLVKRPDVEGGKPKLMTVEASDALKTYMRTQLLPRLEASKRWKPSPQQMHNPDPVIAITTDGRFAGLDPRFFGAKIDENTPSKLNLMADEIVKEYTTTATNQYASKDGKKEKTKGGTQIVFYNLGFGEASQANRGFNARDALTKRLVDGGVKREHILWFDDADTDAKKEAAFKAMRSGEARILIGSSKKMGTGVNVQKRLTALHYFDPPWYPSDIEQPHGRIIRQGNQNEVVRINWYATKGTYDSTMWQMVARKQRFIDQAFMGDKNVRGMEDISEASQYEQAAAVASGDPRALQLAGLRQDVERLERLEKAHTTEQVNVVKAIRDEEWQINYSTKQRAEQQTAFEAIGSKYFMFSTGKVGQANIDKQGDFGNALVRAFENTVQKTLADAGESKTPPARRPVLGTMAVAGKDPIKVVLIPDIVQTEIKSQGKKTVYVPQLTGKFTIGVELGEVVEVIEGMYSTMMDSDALGIARRVANLTNRIEPRIREFDRRIELAGTEIKRLKKKVGAEFENRQEMAEKFADLKRLEAELAAEAEAEKSATKKPPASFAKSGEPTTAERQVTAAWRNLADTNGFFQFKRSEGKSFTDIVRGVEPQATVTMDDDGTATVEVPAQKDATTGKPLGKPKAVSFTVLDGELAMDASALEPGVHRGSSMYAVALNYAHNNGIVFVPDPAGVSDDAMIRRNEHMLSSALKFGTTRHMRPHPDQNIPWTVGDDAANLLALLQASSDNVLRNIPETAALDYDWDSLRFVNTETGERVGEAAFKVAAATADARAARAGVSTLRRAVVHRSLARRAGTREWPRLAARLLQLGRTGLRDSELEGLAYARGADGARGMTAEKLTRLLAAAKQAMALVGVNIEVVANGADLPADITAQDDYDDTVQAAITGDRKTVYFVASRIANPRAAMKLVAHELVGHMSMEQLLGKRWPELRAAIKRLHDAGKWPEVFAEVSRRYERNADGTFRALDDATFAAEAIAVFAERNIQTSILQRAVNGVRAWLRRLGFAMDMSQGELRQMLWEAGQKLEGRAYRPGVVDDVLGAKPEPKQMSMREAVERYSFSKDEVGGSVGKVKTIEFDTSEADDYFDRIEAEAKARDEVLLYHVSPDPNLRKIDSSSTDGASTFGGIFAGSRSVLAWGYGGDSPTFYEVRVPRDKYMQSLADAPQDVIESVVTADLEDLTSTELSSVVEMVRNGALGEDGFDILSQYDATDGDAGWRIQKLQGQVASKLGYLAVGMNDESMSDLVLPGADIRKSRVQQKADNTRQAPPREGLGASGASFAKASTIVDRLQEAINPKDTTLLQRLKDKLSDWRPAALGALQLRHLGELGEDMLPPVAEYADTVQHMQTLRNELQQASIDIVESAMKYQGANKPEALRMYRMLMDATLAGVDPSADHKRLLMLDVTEQGNQEVTPAAVKAFSKKMDELAKLSPGSAQHFIGRKKQAKKLLAQEKKREASHAAMAPEWAKLSPEGKKMWAEISEAYVKQSDKYQDALMESLKAAITDDRQKSRMIAQLKLNFESNRVPFYVPLSRWGEFYVAATAPDGTREFHMQESTEEQRMVKKRLSAAGYTKISSGVKSKISKQLDGASASFIAEVDKVLQEGHAPEKIRNDVYQLYLTTLPEMSMRKNFIHRKGTPGFSEDVVRALASHVFHSSYQIARLKFTHKLDALVLKAQALADAMAEVDAPDANKAGQMVGELRDRHEWVMNPQDSGAAQKLTTLGFLWYLAVSPAAALVNLLQTVIVSFPVLGARYGFGTAAAHLGRTMKQSMKTFGNMDKLTGAEKMTPDEQRAYDEFKRRGTFDKSQVHNLAGLSETDTHTYNPALHKALSWASFLFHRAEVVNREATSMAAYRMAREAGKSHDMAIELGDKAVNQTHFDYSASNRSRYMRGPVAKVLLQFKQYSMGMTWLLGRMAWKSLKDADPATRKENMRSLTGVLGMTAVFSGTMGLPMMGMTMGILNALAAAFGDDDEPWDAETEMRAFLRELLGEKGAEYVMRGPAQAATGLGIASRVGLGELWMRSPDREMEGQALAHYYLEQFAGPVAGGMFVSALRGMQLMEEGQVWRGVETMLPKSIKDGMKALRFADEGVNTLRGDPVVEDLGVFATIAQLMGMAPAAVGNAYDIQGDVKGYADYIKRRRTGLMDAYAMAWRLGDTDAQQETLEKMRAFSRKYPELAITSDSIRRSFQTRARYSAQAENGIVVDPKIRARLESQLGMGAP